MSFPDQPTPAELAAQTERLRDASKKFKRQLQEANRMTPEITDLLQQADDAMNRTAWAEVALLYFRIARMLDPAARWDDFDLQSLLDALTSGFKGPPPRRKYW